MAIAQVPAALTGGMTLISTTTLTGASVTLSSIPATYNNLYVIVRNVLPATDAADFRIRLNADATASRHGVKGFSDAAGTYTFTDTGLNISTSNDNATTQSLSYINIPDYTNTTTWKTCSIVSFSTNSTTPTSYQYRAALGIYNQTSAISSLSFFVTTGNFTSGTVLLYGVN